MKRTALAVLALSTFAGCAASSSDDASEASSAATTSTSINLRTDVSNLVCDDRPNGMVMSFELQGQTFVTKQNLPDIWGCEAQLDTLVKAGAHGVEVVTHAGEGILTTSLVLDGGAWTFTNIAVLGG